MESFSRCIKCMGCRNVCPMCFCKDCALDNLDLVGPASSPPDIPIFHLIRAVDMADRCVDCGMCEAICPAEIPLRQLYRQAVRRGQGGVRLRARASTPMRKARSRCWGSLGTSPAWRRVSAPARRAAALLLLSAGGCILEGRSGVLRCLPEGGHEPEGVRLNGEERYEERLYRGLIEPPGLDCYNVKEGESDLYVCTRGV